MSIIIAIVSNITVLVSQNIICLGCLMRMSHSINKKASPIVSPTTFLLTRFSPGMFLVLQEIFTVKQFFSNSLVVGFDFAVLFVFLRALFHSSAIMKLRINNLSLL